MKLSLFFLLSVIAAGGKNQETRYERRKRKRLDKSPEDKVKKIQSLSQKWCAHFMRRDEHSKCNFSSILLKLYFSELTTIKTYYFNLVLSTVNV